MRQEQLKALLRWRIKILVDEDLYFSFSESAAFPKHGYKGEGEAWAG